MELDSEQLDSEQQAAEADPVWDYGLFKPTFGWDL
jgi:hypothetical protein